MKRRPPLQRHLHRAAVQRLGRRRTPDCAARRPASSSYHWNKDKVLDGAGEGTAKLAKNAVAFSEAKYPVPLAGSTDFSLDNGVVTFRNAELDTDASHISLTGSLKIEEVVTDLP